ncbi:Hypothetical protein ORPV_657 [Orpheovirus IHUMI-LCC2]|uniref:Uncharacterized protein n=1 Tax=Orpheovirus IHUMI-LCC2 TaxID=2023057 RepID=A0A2I2L4X1_9VIRU|nr:Hypothetical protein ORPV_657 [Orpheovirus IHUMI-LCC2]SNW62561.1 Hypothetical protein ORPV_657 [Orpheovirus IHUMI-LCC2]
MQYIWEAEQNPMLGLTGDLFMAKGRGKTFVQDTPLDLFRAIGERDTEWISYVESNIIPEIMSLHPNYSVYDVLRELWIEGSGQDNLGNMGIGGYVFMNT